MLSPGKVRQVVNTVNTCPMTETACWQEMFFNNASPICVQTSPTVWQERMQPSVTMDWINYQGGNGSHFNPIVVEDDWFRESRI